MKTHVDKDLCIGCGLCPSMCPDIYEMDDDGLAIAKNPEVEGDLADCAKEAAESCPVDAISVE